MKPDVLVELKSLRLHGMAGAWADLVEQGGHSTIESSRWLIEHLLQAEATDRAMRSVSHQMHVARFPVHRDLAGFDFEVSPVDRKLVTTLATTAFTDDAHNAVLVGGPGTGKTHLATAIGVAGITKHGKRVRFYSTVDLVNALEQEKAQGKAGRIAASLLRLDLVILDELGYLPFSQAGGALLFHLLSRLYEHTSVVITTNLDFAEWYEIDAYIKADDRPTGITRLATAEGFPHDQFMMRPDLILFKGDGDREAHRRADMTIYRNEWGGLVLCTGSVAWIGALPIVGETNGVGELMKNLAKKFST